eukprot:6359817-Prymnesium_polylepis.1
MPKKQTIASLMRDNLEVERQKKSGFYGNRIEDTKRCVFPDDKAKVTEDNLVTVPKTASPEAPRHAVGRSGPSEGRRGA